MTHALQKPGKLRLGVNIDHVATVRNARGSVWPDPLRAALLAARKKGSEIIVYPDSQHGFHADYRASYDPKAAADAWSRMLAHFAAHGVKPKAFKPTA